MFEKYCPKIKELDINLKKKLVRKFIFKIHLILKHFKVAINYSEKCYNSFF